MTSRFPGLLAAALSLLLAGCTTTPKLAAPHQTAATAPLPKPPQEKPDVPPPSAPPPVEVRRATLRGSEESSTLLDNFTAFVRSVDGQPISAGRQGWDQAIQLNPGFHRIGVEFVRGSFFARSELTLVAEPGAAYELRQTSDAQVYGQHTFCEFTIVNMATGGKACAPKRVALEKSATGN